MNNKINVAMMAFDGIYFDRLYNCFWELDLVSSFNNMLEKINLELFTVNYSVFLDPRKRDNIFSKAIIQSYKCLLNINYALVKEDYNEILKKDIVIAHPIYTPENLIKNKHSYAPLDLFVELLEKNEKTIFYFWKTNEEDANRFKINLFDRIKKEDQKHVFLGKMHPFLLEHFYDLKKRKVHEDLINPKIYYKNYILHQKPGHLT